jgi:hypothetical protein
MCNKITNHAELQRYNCNLEELRRRERLANAGQEGSGEKITLVRGTAYLQTTVYRLTTNLKEQDRVININSKDVFFVAYIDLKNKTPLAIIISVDEIVCLSS